MIGTVLGALPHAAQMPSQTPSHTLPTCTDEPGAVIQVVQGATAVLGKLLASGEHEHMPPLLAGDLDLGGAAPLLGALASHLPTGAPDAEPGQAAPDCAVPLNLMDVLTDDGQGLMDQVLQHLHPAGSVSLHLSAQAGGSVSAPSACTPPEAPSASLSGAVAAEGNVATGGSAAGALIGHSDVGKLVQGLLGQLPHHDGHS